MKFNLNIRSWYLKLKNDRAFRLWKIFLRTIGIIVLLGLIAYLIYQIVEAWDQIKTYQWQIQPEFLILSFLIYSINLSMTVFVWSQIMQRLARKLPFWVHFRFYVITILANRLPTPLPYAGARAAAYSTIGIDKTLTLGAFAFEGTVTILSGMVIGVLFLPFSQADNLLLQTGWGLVVITPLLAVVLWPRKLIAFINYASRYLKQTEITVEVSTRDTLLWVLLFMLIWISSGIANWVVVRSVYPVDMHLIPAFIGIIALTGVIGWISQLLFFLPTMAVRQVAVVYFLSAFLPWPVAVAASLLSRMAGMVHELIWVAVVAFFHSHIVSKKGQEK